MKMLPWRHALLALAVVAVWGSNFTVAKLGLRDIPPMFFTFLRFFFAFVPLAFFLKRPAVPWRHLAAYGVLIGAYAGYRGGFFDSMIAMIINIVIAFPFLVVIIIVIAVAGPGLQNIYIAVFLGSWTMYARLARAEMLVERNKDYVQAAKILGFPTSRVLLLHALPNTIGSAVAFSMSDFVLNILMLAGLSFIGFGAQPPMPEWGAMIAEGKEFILDAWWICAMPGLVVVYAGAALSLIGDGLATRLGVSGGGHK